MGSAIVPISLLGENAPFPQRGLCESISHLFSYYCFGLNEEKTEFLPFALHTGLIASELLVQVIGVKVKKFMNKPIQYSNEPLSDIEFIPDFLPSPEELALKKENTKVTISLSSESVAYFKAAAKKHHMQHQKIIRQLLDEYVSHQKSANK